MLFCYAAKVFYRNCGGATSRSSPRTVRLDPRWLPFDAVAPYCGLLDFSWDSVLLLSQGLLCWLIKGGFQVSSGIVEWYRNSYGSDFDTSEVASSVTASHRASHVCTRNSCYSYARKRCFSVLTGKDIPGDSSKTFGSQVPNLVSPD